MRLLPLVLLLLPGCVAHDPLAHYDPRGVVSIIEHQARLVGVDYRDALRRAYASDASALSELFRVTTAADGGGAMLHKGQLWTLLERLGDDAYSRALRAEPYDVRRRVIAELDEAALNRDWSSSYPKTFRVTQHDSESLLRVLNASR